jgi:hypothetical protein
VEPGINTVITLENGTMRAKDSEHICKIELDLDKCLTKEVAQNNLKDMLDKVNIDWHYSKKSKESV